MKEPVRRRWDGSGGSRSLMGLISEARPDQVLVRSVSGDAVSTALRTGLPVLETGTAQSWFPATPDLGSADIPADHVIHSDDTRSGLSDHFAASAPLIIEANAHHAITMAIEAGYRPGPVIHHALLAPFLSASELPPVEHELEVSQAEVEAYGAHSGDMNPLHFDESFAVSMGFEGTITHGMIFNGWVTRYLGMEWPGPGTIFRRSNTVFLGPVYPDKPHRIRISVPVADRKRGNFLVLAQLLEQNGDICTLSYSDIVHRDVAWP